MSRFRIWLWLINKRLFKKIGFLAILLLIPLLTLSVSLAERQESGVLKIVLAAEGGGDSAAQQMINTLETEESIILFEKVDSVEAARNAVVSAEADAAWIFPENTADAISKFLTLPGQSPFISVIQREQTTMLSLSVEKISQTVFPHVADDVFLRFIRQNVPQMDNVDDSVLLGYYNTVFADVELFDFGETKADQDSGLTTAPIRGLLAVLIVVSGMAASILFHKDELLGTFGMLPISGRRFVVSLSQQSAIFWTALASLLALFVSGIWLSLAEEILNMAIYAFSVAAFCSLLRRCAGKIHILAALCPAITVILIAVCPVFFQNSSLRLFQLLFPTYYYLTAVHNQAYLLYMFLYGSLLWGANALICKFSSRI